MLYPRRLFLLIIAILAVAACSPSGGDFTTESAEGQDAVLAPETTQIADYRAARDDAAKTLNLGGPANQEVAFVKYVAVQKQLAAIISSSDFYQLSLADQDSLRKDFSDLQSMLPLLEVMKGFFVLTDADNPNNNVLPLLEATLILASTVNVVQGGEFFEVGAGLGPLAVAAALNGSNKVYVSDLNPLAVLGLEENFDALAALFKDQHHTFQFLEGDKLSNARRVFAGGNYKVLPAGYDVEPLRNLPANEQKLTDIAANMPQSPGAASTATAAGDTGTSLTCLVVDASKKFLKRSGRLHLINFAYASPKLVDGCLKNAGFQSTVDHLAIWFEKDHRDWFVKKVKNLATIKELILKKLISPPDLGIRSADDLGKDNVPAFIKVRLLTGSLASSGC